MNKKIVGLDGQPISPVNKQAQAQVAGPQVAGPQTAGPQAPFQPPVDPNTGQPLVNPSTGQPYTQEEFEKAQAEAMQTVELGCKMLGRVFPDTLLIIGPGGIVHASGEVFRLNKMCRMAAEDLDKHGETMFRKMGWGARRPGGPAPMMMPGAGGQQPPATPMTPEDQKKFKKEIETAIQAQAAGQPPVSADKPPAKVKAAPTEPPASVEKPSTQPPESAENEKG